MRGLVVCCWFRVGGWLVCWLFDVCCLLSVFVLARCWLAVVCCLLFGVCGLLIGVR